MKDVPKRHPFEVNEKKRHDLQEHVETHGDWTIHMTEGESDENQVPVVSTSQI